MKHQTTLYIVLLLEFLSQFCSYVPKKNTDHTVVCNKSYLYTFSEVRFCTFSFTLAHVLCVAYVIQDFGVCVRDMWKNNKYMHGTDLVVLACVDCSLCVG